jgi:methylmalonyl-CoA/ethylmalonyl-CoA epimerase
MTVLESYTLSGRQFYKSYKLSGRQFQRVTDSQEILSPSATAGSEWQVVKERFFMEFRIDHLGIAVKSLAAAKSIYERLGMTVSAEETVEEEKVRVVMVPVGESRLELLEATSEDSTIAKFVAKRGEGLHHVCLRVSDLSAAVAKLKNDGVRLVSNEIKVGAGGHKYIFVHPQSAGGVLLELVEGGPHG